MGNRMKLVFSVVYLLFACASMHAEPRSVGLTAFPNLANQFAERANLPIRLDKVHTNEERVTSANLRFMAREVALSMGFLKKTGDEWIFETLHVDDITPEQIDTLANNLISEGFIQSGFWLFYSNWVLEDDQTVETIGTLNSEGLVVYEPILYFQSLSTVEPGPVERGSWHSGPWRHVIANGFGAICVEQEWTVSIESADCEIQDPDPHVEITKQLSNCWGWKQAASMGQENWFLSNASCPERREQCIKWAVVAYVATGFSNIKVEAGAGGQFNGIALDANISFHAHRFGSEATFHTIRNLCSLSGPREQH